MRSYAMNRFSTTSLFLLLFLLFDVGNDQVKVNAQDLGDSEGSGDEVEQILYSNPQFYNISQRIEGDAPPEALPVIGLLFNIRSKLENDDAIIYITGFDFYTSLSGSLFYELRSREGTYYDQDEGIDGGVGIGGWKSFHLISYGLGQGSGECTQVGLENVGVTPVESAKSLSDAHSCPLTVIPKEDFNFATSSDSDDSSSKYPWTLQGINATRSFYITMASAHLLVSPSTSADPFDTVVTASTPDLDLYEGVAARTYPLHNVSEYYYEEPIGFIGKVHYRVEGRRGVPSQNPSAKPSLSPTTTLTPTEFGETKAPQTTYPTLSPTLRPTTEKPTPRPTKRCRPNRPCLTPPRPDPPTGSPIISSPVPVTIEMMVYIENVPGRTMSDRELQEYEETITDFLKENEELRKNGVKTSKAWIFYHNVFEEEEKGNGRGRGNGASGKEETSTEAFTYYYDTNSGYYPKTFPTIYVMTKVEVMTKLPFDVAAFFVWDELTNYEMTLIDTFNSKSLFVSYFREISNITVEVVEGLSEPPTGSPTKFSLAEDDEIQDDDSTIEKRNLYTSVGIGLGCLWIFLTICSFSQILKHRRIVIEQSELDRSRQQKMEKRRSTIGNGVKLTPFAKLSLSMASIDWSGPLKKRGPRHEESAMLTGAEAELSEDTSTADDTSRPSRQQRSPPRVSFV